MKYFRWSGPAAVIVLLLFFFFFPLLLLFIQKKKGWKKEEKNEEATHSVDRSTVIFQKEGDGRLLCHFQPS